MGNLIRNLSSEKKACVSRSRDLIHSLNTLQKQIDNKNVTINNIERKIQDVYADKTKMNERLKVLFLEKLAYTFRNVSGYKTDDSKNVNYYDHAFMDIEKKLDTIKLILPSLVDAMRKLKIDLNDLKKKQSDDKKNKIKVEQKIRHLRHEIANLNRHMSESRIKKITLSEAFTNIDGNLVIKIQYHIYDTNTTNVYASEKTFVKDSKDDIWYQIKPSGVKVIKSLNKLHQIKSVLNKSSNALQ